MSKADRYLRNTSRSRRPRWLTALIVVLLSVAGSILTAIPLRKAWQQQKLAGAYQSVGLVRPKQDPTALVVIFSRQWTNARPIPRLAQQLVDLGAAVVLINPTQYFQQFSPTSGRCSQLAEDLGQLSKRVSQYLGLDQFIVPYLIGLDSEARFVAQVVAASVPGDIGGALMQIGPADQNPLALLCPQVSEDKRLVPVLSVPAADGEARVVADVARYIQDNPQAAHLPLIEFPVNGSKQLVIVLSGDGGWREIDDGLASGLQQRGIAVVGWDSLRYFWKLKTPNAVASDLARIMTNYQQRWKIEHVALAGYSFGADVLPFAYLNMPPTQRAKVEFLSFMGLGRHADFKVRIGGWLGWGERGRRDVLPQLQQIDMRMVQCVYGQEETHPVCPTLKAQGAHVVLRPGGHHFDHDTNMLASQLMIGWSRRVSTGQAK